MKTVVKILLGLLCVGLLFWYYYKDEFTIKNIEESLLDNTFLVSKNTSYNYQKCMNDAYKSDYVDEMFDSLKNEYSGTYVAFSFKDLNNDYELHFNNNKIFYSASASKIFDVIYVFENNIDLNTTLVYTPDIDMKGSIGMKKHRYYDNVSILELISHLLMYSDNTAHYMLIRYIGVNNLKEYFKEYNLNIGEGDPFVRNYTSDLALKSVERLFKLLDDDKYSSIKEYMNNFNMNSLSFDDVVIYHKYGWIDSTYHDIGFYDGDNPYFVSILTTSGTSDYRFFVNEISKKIYNIYNKNLELKKEYCNNKI